MMTVTDALSGNWEEVVELHDFAWAKEQMRAGRRVIRKTGSLVYAFDQTSLFNLADIEATDWVLA